MPHHGGRARCTQHGLGRRQAPRCTHHDPQSETANIGSYHIDGHDIFKIAEFDVDVAAKAMLVSVTLQTVVGWDSANVRQGASLTVNRNTPLQHR